MNINYFAYSVRGRMTVLAATLCLLLAGAFQPALSQKLNSEDRSRGHLMLDALKDDIKKNYYDPTYRGVDLDARFKAAHEMIKEAKTLGQVFGIIAQTMLSFNDSHTFFIPPEQTVRAEYGWEMKAIGDKCYVVAVKPGSAAEKVGLKTGDQLISIEGVNPKREDLWKLRYLYYSLRPAPGMRLVVLSPGETQPRQLDVPAKVTRDKRTLNFSGMDDGHDIHRYIWDVEREARLYRHRTASLGDELIIWKMPRFDMSDEQVDGIMDKVRDRKALILDLRGNGGGYVNTLLRLVGHFFDREIKIADLKGRKQMEPHVAKTRGNKSFKGKLVVLIDSESGSASEMFARIVQLEKRGTVIGDRSAGAVMRARHFSHDIGMDIKVFFASSVTDADMIMTDGKSLENTGVTPDEVLLPTGADLAANRDAVMSRAAELVGVKLEPEKAGALFPLEWGK